MRGADGWQALAAESRRTEQPLDTHDLEARLLADDAEETNQIVGTWTYVGTAGATTSNKPSPWRSPPAAASTTCGKRNGEGLDLG